MILKRLGRELSQKWRVTHYGVLYRHGYNTWFNGGRSYGCKELEDLRIPQGMRKRPLVPPQVRPGGNACRATIC